MAKTRVYELARELGIESKLLMNTLKTVGINVASHQSTLTPEEIDQAKRAMSGEAVSQSANKPKLATAKKSGSVRVIRRRRRPAEEQDEATPTVEATETAKDEESKRATAKASVEEEARSVEGGTSREQSIAERARAAVENLFKKETPSEGTGSISEKEFAGREGLSGDETVEAPKAPSKKRSVGATIVRKATPEEVEQQQADREAQKKKKTRREDSKGTKYTGIGSLDQPPAGEFMPEPVSTKDSGSTRKDKGKDKSRRNEEEEIAKRKTSTKSKREAVNTRMLLNELEDQAEELIETPYGLKAKTVYTPNTAQKKRDLRRRRDLKKTEITVARAAYRVVTMGDQIQVGELARQLKVKASELIKKLMDQGIMVTVNQEIDFDTASLLASDYNYEVKSMVKSFEDIIGRDTDKLLEKASELKPPIVTVMGHVDHGKTSILDAIRKSDVVAGEAGGITQHIGAYSVTHDGKKIAFLDTPGHEAFSSMRARGANTTDIVVLVVAADDGVMPQTVEAISHAKDAGVPIIVAVNKIDKENKNVDRVYTELTEHGIQSEEWGGDTQFVKVSALQKIGIDDLLEAILLQAELLELKTRSDIPADGVVVEAHLDTGRGAVATIMVRHGTLRSGDYLVAGTEGGRVRAMYDHNGKPVKEAGPSTPVEVLGLSGVPEAGDRVNVVTDEKTARDVAQWRKDNAESLGTKSTAQSLEDLLGKMKADETPELPIIVKADTQGSVEAIVESVGKLNTEKVRNKVIHKAVGGVSESDLSLAEASGAVIVGFNVRAARGLDDKAEEHGIVLKYFSVIYDLVDAVKSLMEGKLPPIREEVVVGRAEVRQLINVPKIGTVAGSAVVDGKITRNAHLRLIRDDIVIYDGKIGSLRRFKDDVKEVKTGYECGIGIEDYNDIKSGDVIEAYEIKETRPTLELGTNQ